MSKHVLCYILISTYTYWYQRFELVISLIHAHRWYQQLELLISLIPIVDISNSNCWYHQFKLRWVWLGFRTMHLHIHSLVEIESRNRHYKRILLFLRAHGCKYECKQCIFSRHIAPQIRKPEKWNKMKTVCYYLYGWICWNVLLKIRTRVSVFKNKRTA